MFMLKRASFFTLGIAVFSMFFGAGNVIFPLNLGLSAGDQFSWSFFGLLLTSIGAPLLGLYGALLFEGNCQQFFARIGKVPGTAMILLLVLALGPFGAMPRCLTLTHTALQPIFGHLSLGVFTFVAALLILFCIFKRELLLPILGKVLSPLLLLMLMLIIGFGIAATESTSVSALNNIAALQLGLLEGYKTMDLLAAILFASTIWRLMKEREKNPQAIYKNCLYACLLAGFLLTVMYLGLGLAARANSHLLQQTSADHLLSVLSYQLLGPKLGIIANLTIALACFTTVISLAVAAVDVLWQTLQTYPSWQNKERIFYRWGIVLLTLSTAIFANVGFENISIVISFVVKICYPAIIILTLCNILHKKVGLKIIKAPVLGALGATLLIKLF